MADKVYLEGVHPHPCEFIGCKETVPYDDEPYCFEHSPDSGSHFIGYSYNAKHNKS